MRTSGQLKKVDYCEFNPNANIRNNSVELRDARIQKKIIRKALMGEPIADYRVALANEFDAADAIWETDMQRNNTLRSMAERIEKLVDWEMTTPERANKQFRKEYNNGEPIVVNYFGEEVQAIPDYVVDTPEKLYVVKIKTGEYSANIRNNCFSQEGYCLGLAGEKMADGTNKEVVVQYIYLKNNNPNYTNVDLSKTESGQYMIPFDTQEEQGCQHIIEEVFDQRAKDIAMEDHEFMVNDHSGCSPEECSSCSHRNICQFEEPPIPAPPSETVRDIDVTPSFEQARVIEFEEGNARVNAGPGAGKTFVVGSRIAKLVEKGYDSNKICVLTFTNAGAGEMTERAMRIAAKKGVPLDPEHITSSTFNAFCQDIIRDHYEELGYSRCPTPVKDSEKRGIINRMIDQFPRMKNWKYPVKKNEHSSYSRYEKTMVASERMLSEFNAIKAEGYTRDRYPQEWNRMYDQKELDMLFIMYKEFNNQLKKINKIEFADQLGLVNELLEMKPDLFNEMGYEHIIVDEFQDTDLPQIELLKKMCDTTNFKSLMCVGDDSQSIFAFRHTTPEFMINFATYFGQFTDFSLLENHRSNKLTIDVANKIIGKCDTKVDKDLVPLKAEGIKPVAKGFYSQKTEFDWIASEVAKRWNEGKQDIAVIMSDSIQLNAFADALSKYGIPSTMKSPVPVMSNSRVKALLTFYDSFLGRSTQGLLDYKNAATHGSLRGKSATELESIASDFEKDIKECKKDAKTFIAFAEALDSEGNDECYQDFLEGFKESTSFDEIVKFMEDFKLYGDKSKFKREGKYDGVCLTTIHSSKGLEWDTTFLCVDKLDDVRYHNSPTRYRQNGEYDEQLRKMFVGCTRAKEELVITGQYVLKMVEGSRTSAGYKIDNDFLHYAYEFCDKAWDYEYTEYNRVKERENLEKKGLLDVRTVSGRNVADIIARHTSPRAESSRTQEAAPEEERDEIG